MSYTSETRQLLAEFESLPKKIEDLMMPDIQLDNYSGESSVKLVETMKLVRSALMDALRGQVYVQRRVSVLPTVINLLVVTGI